VVAEDCDTRADFGYQAQIEKWTVLGDCILGDVWQRFRFLLHSVCDCEIDPARGTVLKTIDYYFLILVVYILNY